MSAHRLSYILSEGMGSSVEKHRQKRLNSLHYNSVNLIGTSSTSLSHSILGARSLVGLWPPDIKY